MIVSFAKALLMKLNQPSERPETEIAYWNYTDLSELSETHHIAYAV